MEPIKYLVENPRDLQWGLSACNAGFEENAPGTPYPTLTHGKGYYYSPEKGRILEEYQLLYISEDKGTLSTYSAGNVSLKAGDMFLLFPGEWHTYQPDSATGWKHYWIGFKGINIDNRVQHGFLKKESPVFHIGLNEDIVRLYRQTIEIAHQEEPYFQQMLAGIINYLLGLMYSLSQKYKFKENKEAIIKINRSRVYMREHIDSNIGAEEIASHVEMSYSLFRKLFKKYTGYSPSSYFKDIKLQLAKELLLNTTMNVQEVSYTLGFESTYFSTLFKKKTGLSPVEFRKRMEQ